MSLKKNCRRCVELETCAVLTLAALVIGYLTNKTAWNYAATALLVIALFVKPAARSISAAWLKLSELLGAINSRILLGGIYYLLLTPLSFLYRLFNKNALNLNPPRTQSLFIIREHRFTSADFEKMW